MQLEAIPKTADPPEETIRLFFSVKKYVKNTLQFMEGIFLCIKLVFQV